MQGKLSLFGLLFVLYALLLSGCGTNPVGSATPKGINITGEANLDTTVKVDIFDTLLRTTKPVASLTDAAIVAELVSILDATLPATPKTLCMPRFTLRFQSADGILTEIGYYCDGETAFLRGEQDFFNGEDYAAPEAFILLMIELLDIPISDEAPVGVPADDAVIGLANPASVFCEEHGGQVDMRTDTDEGQYGVCVFNDGSECEEWAFFRGECRIP